ncbi:class I adenylate-forming enzyme family protein [Nocardioides sp. NPDC092400]|uniref:class I adenylate-forming enzyme family protein n=1 Tax=Nocardioides sp. NPDC092400 TaxID=3155196 RepID=UPI00343CD4C3
MSTIEERRARLDERFPAWVPRTLDSWLDVCAAEHTARPLVITDNVSWSYGEVADLSRRLADGLVALGVRPGDRVGMLMANYAEFVPLKFAIARTGAVAIPFNFLYRREELGYVLKQSRCSVLITMDGFAGLDYQGMLDEIVPDWASDRFADRERTGDGPDDLRHVAVFATGHPTAAGARAGAPTYADLLALGDANPGGAAQAGHLATDIGDMLYTSGSTGSPKGVLVTHDAVLRTGYASAYTRAYEDARRILFSLPCYHMFGYVEGLLSAMYVGGAVIMQTSFSAEGYLSGIEKHRATDILCVPTMAIAIVESPARFDYDLTSLSALLCGSAPAPVWLWEKVQEDFGVSEIVTGYGMTECGGAMTLTFPEDELILSSTTVGRVKLAGAASVEGHDTLCTYRTVDPVSREALPQGAVGELVSAGPTMMLGYYDKPVETAATLRDAEVYSGDLGLVREDGYLVLTGRSKELYKSGGELVMPKEVEEVLAVHPAVSQAFAIGVVDERWGEIGVAVVVRAPGAEVDEQELVAYAKANLARFKVPKRFVFLDPAQLPTTPTGKVQKFKLVEMVAREAAAKTVQGVPS